MMKRLVAVALSIPIVLAAQVQPADCSDFLVNHDGLSGPNYLADSLERDETQPIYSADVEDAWNRVFHLLFARRVELSVSDAFLTVGELSRRLFLGNPQSSGFKVFDNTSAAYLPDAGNDYFFASRVRLARSRQARKRSGEFLPYAAVLVSLQQRCAACHGDNALQLTTFAPRVDNANPPVKILDPAANERAAYVIQQKIARQDFRSLREDWGN